MSPEFAERLLNILLENAVRILDGQFGVDRAEPTFFQVIDLIREHPFLKRAVLDRIGSLLATRATSTGVAPTELVELIAHEFRWVELRAMAERRLLEIYQGDKVLAMGDIYEKILAAMSDSWEDREFYVRYRP